MGGKSAGINPQAQHAAKVGNEMMWQIFNALPGEHSPEGIAQAKKGLFAPMEYMAGNIDINGNPTGQADPTQPTAPAAEPPVAATFGASETAEPSAALNLGSGKVTPEPTTGAVLGGAIADPPAFWTDQEKKKKTQPLNLQGQT